MELIEEEEKKKGNNQMIPELNIQELTAVLYLCGPVRAQTNAQEQLDEQITQLRRAANLLQEAWQGREDVYRTQEQERVKPIVEFLGGIDPTFERYGFFLDGTEIEFYSEWYEDIKIQERGEEEGREANG